MTNLKISEMPKVIALSGDEYIPILKDRVNVITDVESIKSFCNCNNGSTIIAHTLPAIGNSNSVYLIPNGSTRSNDIYDEYIWIDSSKQWEFLGNKQITVDLTNYYTKSEVDEMINQLRDELIHNNGLNI